MRLSLILGGLVVCSVELLFGTSIASLPNSAKKPAAHQQPSAIPRESLGQISGRILRADTGQPLSKAVVTLIPTTQPVQGVSARTDATGSFHFKEVVPGTYRLRAQRNGFVTQLYGQRGSGPGLNITLNTSQRLEKVEVRLVRSGVIAGTVLDEDMEPVEGLAVHAVRMRFEKGGRIETSVIRTTQTDDAGDYRLPGLNPGAYLVQAGGRGNTVSINLQAPPVSFGTTFYPAAESRDDASRIQVGGGAVVRGTDVRVRSARTYTISGVVVDAGPASARTYSVGFAMRGGTATSSAQSDGSFVFHGVAAGDYTLVASVSDETGPARRGFVNVKIVDSDVRVAIETGRSVELEGEARMEAEQRSFDGIRVELMPDRAEAVSVAGAIEQDGSFKLRNIPIGKYAIQLAGREDDVYLKQVRCLGDDYSAKLIVLSLEEKIVDCVLMLSRAVSTVAGRVAEDGKPSGGLAVVLVPQEMERRRNPRHTVMGQSDDDGTFKIKGVIPGDYFAFAVPLMDDSAYYDLEFADRNREKASRITVKAQEPLVVNLKPTTPR